MPGVGVADSVALGVAPALSEDVGVRVGEGDGAGVGEPVAHALGGAPDEAVALGVALGVALMSGMATVTGVAAFAGSAESTVDQITTSLKKSESVVLPMRDHVFVVTLSGVTTTTCGCSGPPTVHLMAAFTSPVADRKGVAKLPSTRFRGWPVAVELVAAHD